MGNISEYDMYLFGAGVHYDMYMKLGAHPCKKGRWQGVNFAVWAPNAKRVWFIGSFILMIVFIIVFYIRQIFISNY